MSGDNLDPIRASGLLREAAAYLRGLADVVTRFPDVRDRPLPDHHRDALRQAIEEVAGIVPPHRFIDHILPRLRDPALREAPTDPGDPVTYWDALDAGLPMCGVLDAMADRLDAGGTLSTRREGTRTTLTIPITPRTGSAGKNAE